MSILLVVTGHAAPSAHYLHPTCIAHAAGHAKVRCRLGLSRLCVRARFKVIVAFSKPIPHFALQDEGHRLLSCI